MRLWVRYELNLKGNGKRFCVEPVITSNYFKISFLPKFITIWVSYDPILYIILLTPSHNYRSVSQIINGFTCVIVRYKCLTLGDLIISHYAWFIASCIKGKSHWYINHSILQNLFLNSFLTLLNEVTFWNPRNLLAMTIRFQTSCVINPGIWCALLLNNPNVLSEESIEYPPAAIAPLRHIITADHLLNWQIRDRHHPILHSESGFDHRDECVRVAWSTCFLVAYFAGVINPQNISQVKRLRDFRIRDLRKR